MAKKTQAERMRERAKRDFARGKKADEDFRRFVMTKAREQYGSDDVEIDDDARISKSPDAGTWVQAWVWVED